MKRGRVRIGSALVALLTLTALQTEAAWASWCAPAAPAAEATAEMEDCGNADGSHDQAPESPAPEHDSRVPADCPLLAIGVGGSCVPASLPESDSQSASVGTSPGRVGWVHEASPDLLFASAPFHPPRL